jgi:hypothetical protein
MQIVTAKEDDIKPREARVNELETLYQRGLAENRDEKQRLLDLSAELTERSQQVSGGLVILPDEPEDFFTTLQCIGDEAERLSLLTDLASGQLDDESQLKSENLICQQPSFLQA